MQTKEDKKAVRQHDRSVLIVMIIYVFFILAWMPFLISRLVGHHLAHSKELLGVIKTYSLLFLLSNSLVNPIIYLKVRPHFRKAFRLLMHTSPHRWHTLTHDRLGSGRYWQKQLNTHQITVDMNVAEEHLSGLTLSN